MEEEQKNMTSEERIKRINRIKQEEERRKRVDRMKQCMVALLLVLILIPTVCCAILFVKMNKMQKQIDTLVIMHQQQYTDDSKKGSKDGVAKAAGVEKEKEEDTASSKQKEKEKPKGEMAGKKVYLTFDDGPSENTDHILEILDEYDVKATFFVIGKNDKTSKKRYQKIYDSGHTLGMHSYSHSYSGIYKSSTAFKKDLKRIQTLLYDVTGEKPTIYRFPGGSSNTVSKQNMKTFIKILNEKQIDYYDWNVINGDATGKKITSDQMVKNVINGVKTKNTSIVLMHDAGGKDRTVKALPVIIKKLKKMDAQILPITESTEKIQHIKADSVKTSTKKGKKK
ncbi:MAG: polysaccharide deacetylase [Clostridiales bacterium]|nr:polysaccharide deacetylase [Clostridiales bacterium]